MKFPKIPLRLASLASTGTLVVSVGVAGVATAADTGSYVLDSFSRSVSAGWGAAETGGSWSNQGASGSSSVSSGVGLMTVGRGTSVSAVAPSASASSVDVVVDVVVDRAATGSGQYVSLIGRGNAATGYRATARIQSDASVVLSLRRTVNGSEAILASRTVSGLSAPAGTVLRLRMAVVGSSPASLAAKAWKAGSTEPQSWYLTATDANTSVPASGPVGLFSYVSGSATNAPVGFAFDNLKASSPTSSSTTTSTSPSKPGAGNTGFPDGTSFKVLSAANKPYSADGFSSDGSVYTIKTPNAVYDGWRLDSFVEVRAPGVRFTRSLFRGASTSVDRGLLLVAPEPSPAGQPSAVIEDSSFIPRSPSWHVDGIRGSNFAARRVEVTGTVDGLHIHGTSSRTDPNAGNVVLEASWIHDLTYYPGDPSHSDGSHNDAVQIVGGRNIRIQGNTFSGSIYNAALQVTQDRNTVANLTYTGNWPDGGACSVNIAHRPYAAIQGLSVTSNKFGRNSKYRCPMIMNKETAQIANVSGNVWEDGKTPLPGVVLN